jgi:UDP-2-acetamido-3-amino-2,3-dideoxy-glucuronate N-acetyltransferase
MVGAGAVVLRDVPAYAVVVGNPARVVRYLDPAAPPETATALGSPD